MSATNTSGRLLSRPEAASYLGGISAQTLANWAAKGAPKLPFVKIGSRVFYTQVALDRFISENTTHAGEARS